MNGIYHSSLGPRVRVSMTAKHLMQSLRHATQDAVQMGDVCTNDNALPRARLALVEYIAKLEDDLAVHQAQRTEQQRRERMRLYPYQRESLAMLMRDPPKFDLTAINFLGNPDRYVKSFREKYVHVWRQWQAPIVGGHSLAVHIARKRQQEIMDIGSVA